MEQEPRIFSFPWIGAIFLLALQAALYAVAFNAIEDERFEIDLRSRRRLSGVYREFNGEQAVRLGWGVAVLGGMASMWTVGIFLSQTHRVTRAILLWTSLALFVLASAIWFPPWYAAAEFNTLVFYIFFLGPGILIRGGALFNESFRHPWTVGVVAVTLLAAGLTVLITLGEAISGVVMALVTHTVIYAHLAKLKGETPAEE